MKKLLAMVLALVMTLSLAVSANAAFKDADKVADSYEEAVAVLNGMGVFKGYEDGSFQPQGDITRAEVAAIVYRVYTKDVKDSKASLYATYNKFSDMTGAGWAAGYIGYCANAELVKGYPNGTFQPSGKVTGYEVLAMILRAIGYDKNGEFSGADWALHVAQTAQQAGVLKNIKGVDLNAAATRELVAEMLFRAVADAKMVTYTAAFGYQTVSLGGDKLVKDNVTLGKQNFDLDKDTDTQDNWGRPTVTWTYNVGDKKTVLAVDPDATFTVATAQCDICKALDEDTSAKIVEAYTNGVADKTLLTTYKATATTTKVGAQGELLEYYAVKDGYRLVVIDTYLAKVTKVTDAKLDAQGHVRADAKLALDVYGHDDITLEGSDGENFENVKDEYVLVYVNDKDEQNSEVVKTVTPATVKYSGISYRENQLKIDNAWVKFAAKYSYDKTVLDKFANIQVVYDLYDNVIGTLAVDADENVVVVDAMYTEGNKNPIFKSDLVGTDAKITESTVDSLTSSSKTYKVEDIEARADNNADKYGTLGIYDKLYTYTVNDDEELELTYVKNSIISTTASTDIANKDRNVKFKAVTVDGSSVSKVRFTDETIFLVHENDGSYTSVTGDKMEDIKAANIEVMMKDGYAEVVYLYGDIYRASEVNQVYVPIQTITDAKLENQKIDGENVKCLLLDVVPTSGDAYTAYLPLTDVQVQDIKDALAYAKENDVDVEYGATFLRAIYLKDTTVLSAIDDDDLYSCTTVTDVKNGTVTLDKKTAKENSFAINDVENIYVIENGKITKGSPSDVKADSYVHVFWTTTSKDYVADELYVDKDLADYAEEYNDNFADLQAAKTAADKAVTDAEKAQTEAQADVDAAQAVVDAKAALDVAQATKDKAVENLAAIKAEDPSTENHADRLAAAEKVLEDSTKALTAAQEAYDEAAAAADKNLDTAKADKAAADKAVTDAKAAQKTASDKVDDYQNQHILYPHFVPKASKV